MKFAAVAAAVLALTGSVNAFGPLCGSKPSTRVLPEPTVMPNDFQVAFIGDAGNGNEQGEVLSLIKKWGAKVVIHSGDFEYDNDPALFESNINAVLGPDFPYFASIGNHDNLRWSGHEERLVARLQRFGGDKNCTGDYGVNMVCNWNGLYFVLSGVGTRGSGHADYIDEVFTDYPAVWKVVSWHKNQRKMQIGGKLDETGWAVYDTSRKHGAIIATGHEHSYCRSHLLSNFEDQVIASTNKTLNLQVGETFAFVSGLGGKDIRDWNENLRTNPWWAAVGASDNGIGDGALLCTFNIGGNLRKAHCFFEDTTGKIWDEFDIYSNLPETKEELAASLAKFDKAEPACRSKWIEVAVKRANADVREDLATGHVTCGESVINFESKSITVMKFENVPVKKGARIQHAYLQVYGATTAKELPQFLLSGSTDRSPLHCGKSAAASFASRKTTKASVEWSEEDEEWETENVWVSPDLKDIVTELINDPAWEEGNPISINMLGQGRQSFYSFDFAPCFAPTLAIELEPEC